MDFGSKSEGGRRARADDRYYPQFFLDFLGIVGKPGCVLSCRGPPLFDNVTVSFGHWAKPYGAKHMGGIGFDVTGRTFRIASAATREDWFIVMHPTGTREAELPRSGAKRRRRIEEASRKSGMPMDRARPLAAYIVDVFTSAPGLGGAGVEARWRPGSKNSQRMSMGEWMLFQEAFLGGYAAWAQARPVSDPFWRTHTPAFHAYDYGANIPIPVSDRLYELP